MNKLALLCLISIITFSCSKKEVTKPNIILIMSDDMGYSDIGCYGGVIDTPVLDGLAENGLRMTRFYNTARCCPTRASLLTGLYPQQAGIGHMMNDKGTDAYRGDLSKKAVTIAEVMKEAGYSTYMSGKWHVTPYVAKDNNTSKHNWPLQRGFDKFFGTIHGAGSFYDPNSLTRDNEFIAPEDDFYYTDAISDNAVKFIEGHSGENPFFMYVPYTAAHWPMHARPEDIKKYIGKFDDGWDAMREKKYQKMLDMGLIKPEWKLSGKDDIPEWEDAEMKDWYASLMEVYAAMVDNMDQGIGRVMGALEKKGIKENTLVFFLQDNGGCAEQFGFRDEISPNYKDIHPDTLKPMAPGEFQTNMVPRYTRDGRPVMVGKGLKPGGDDTYLGYGKPWANASNTPFRMYKHWVHEGGISTPLIVHWPDVIKAKNEFRNQPGHLIDIMATCIDVGGAKYPETYNGNLITPLEGVSLVPAFSDRPLDREAIYWEHEGNRAVARGKWKLVSNAGGSFQFNEIDTLTLDQWSLYDLELDRTELNDLSSEKPELKQEMIDLWMKWAKKTGTIPRPVKKAS